MVYIHRGMERLNYHHLLYFSTVAREGSVARASLRLGLKQPTVSAQIHELEKQLGRRLLERHGRGLRLTEDGRIVLLYAENIFALGEELVGALRGEVAPARLTVGLGLGLPSGLASHLLRPLLQGEPRPLLRVVEGEEEWLRSQLVARALDVVLTDRAPSGAGRDLRVRLLCESPVAAFAPEPIGRRLRRNFPASLQKVPALLPAHGGLSAELQRWRSAQPKWIEEAAALPRPEEQAEALGAVVFAPSRLRRCWKDAFGLHPVGELHGAGWRLYALSGARSPEPSAVAAVAAAALKEWR